MGQEPSGGDMSGSMLLYLAALLTVVAAALILRSLAMPQRSQGVPRRRARPRQSLTEYVRDYLAAAGIQVETRDVVVIGGAALMVIMGLLYAVGLRLGPLVLIVFLLVANAILRRRAAHLRRMITLQMPALLDMLGREMSSGQGLERSFRRVVRRLPVPLAVIMGRVVSRCDLGQDLHASMVHEARVMRSFEIELLATIMSVNQQFGGGIRDALSSFVNMLRQDERTEKELKAMTGETRMTAWVLGSVPVLVSGFMVMTNPQMLLGMMSSPGGAFALLVAVALQLSGAIVIYRMLKAS